jgi:transposase
LHEVEVLTAQGLTIADAARQVQVTEQTIYR